MDMSLSKACDETELSQESESFVCSVHQEWASWTEGDGEASGAYTKSFSGSFTLSNSMADGHILPGAEADAVSGVFLSDQALLAALEARCGYGPTLSTMLEPIRLFPALPDPMAQVGQV
jgi:hypothetical protein